MDVLVGAVVTDVLRCGTGGDDHPVEFEGPTVGQHQRAFGQVEPLPRHPEFPPDVEFVECLGLTEVDPVGVPFTRQQLLRQRRPIIGTVGFGTDDHHVARERPLAERLRGPEPGE